MSVSFPTISALVVFGIWALLYFRALVEVRRTKILLPGQGVASVPVTAYVPARNEAEVIEASVRALLAEPSIAKLVVIDDGSTDATPEILSRLAKEAPRLVVLRGVGPRPGECGKPAALTEAVRASPAETEWVLFVDADVVLAQGAVPALLAEAERTEADLISLFPQLIFGSFLEALVMPTIGALILRRYPPAAVGDPGSKVAFANGQVILVKAETYRRVGGHEAVAREILEDVRFAQLVKRAGGRLALVDGRALAATRMYASWSELSEGWGKNLHLLLGASFPRTLAWAVLLPLLATAPLAVAISGEVGIFCYCSVLAMQADLRRRSGASPWYAPLAPLGAALAASVLLRSAWVFAAKRPVSWKGRSYTSS